MLIRLCGHFIDNPNHIDKMIAIKGLPEEWLFRPSKYGGKELISPWEPDVEANIPDSVRHLCEPVEVTKVFPPIEKGGTHTVDKTMVIAIRFNYLTQPGMELWEKVERYLDRMTPRDEKVPVPVLVAPNQQSSFAPHMARRTVRGSLELHKTEIPFVDLTPKAASPILSAAAIVAPPQPLIQPLVATSTNATATVTLVPVDQPAPQAPVELKSAQTVPGYACPQCPRVFTQRQHLKMHQTKHAKEAREADKAKVAAGV